MTKLPHSIHRIVAVLILLFAAACAPFTLVPPASTSVANFQVEADIAWNKVNQLRVESSAPLAYWTADGPNLNAILFIGGVKTGLPILKITGDTSQETLFFRDTMTPTEIVELWEAAITKINQTTIAKGSNIQPVQFAGTNGFRFDFQYVTKDEVDRSGVGYAAVKDGRLYLIFYSGTKLHHYRLRLANAQRIMQTARITG